MERPDFFFKRGIPPSPDAIGKLNQHAFLFKKHDLRLFAVQKSCDPFKNTRLRHGCPPCYDILTGAGSCRAPPLSSARCGNGSAEYAADKKGLSSLLNPLKCSSLSAIVVSPARVILGKRSVSYLSIITKNREAFKETFGKNFSGHTGRD